MPLGARDSSNCSIACICARENHASSARRRLSELCWAGVERIIVPSAKDSGLQDRFHHGVTESRRKLKPIVKPQRTQRNTREGTAGLHSGKCSRCDFPSWPLANSCSSPCLRVSVVK